MSWPLVKVEKVCVQIRGVSYSKEAISDEPLSKYEMLFRGNNINRGGEINYEKLVYVQDSFVNEKQLLKKYDVLVAASTGSKTAIGKNAQFFDDVRVTFGAFCKVLRPKLDLVDPLYFGFFFRRPEYRHYIENIVEGANINNLKNSHINEMLIPLPPLPIQKQIATALEKADTLRQQCKQMEAELSQLAQSVFLDMFGNPATNPMKWDMGTVGDCCESVNYGTSSKADEASGEFPILRMNNITYEGGWNFSSLKYIDLSEKDRQKYLVESGDLLFNRTNSKELVGKTAVYREPKPMSFAGYLVRARCNGKAVPEYLSAVINSRYGKQTLMNMCKSIVGMANINAKEFQKIRLPIPPIELQKKFQSIIFEVNRKKSELDNSKSEFDDLFSSLMQRAFSGELELKDVA